MELNKIYCGECDDIMYDDMEERSIDLIVTSPPYDDLRKYKGYRFSYQDILHAAYYVLVDGGVMVWVVGDGTKDGSESGTSFRHALTAVDIGFKLHDTMIYEKNSPTFPAKRDGNRYTQIFEYMFVFSKGKPKTANLICDKENKWAGHSAFDGSIPPVPERSARNNIWRYTTSFNDKSGHPAVFPKQLAADHIRSWSNPGDIVLDPMCGSGTTCKMAKLLNRKFIGIDISEEYCEIARKRVDFLVETRLFDE